MKYYDRSGRLRLLGQLFSAVEQRSMALRHLLQRLNHSGLPQGSLDSLLGPLDQIIELVRHLDLADEARVNDALARIRNLLDDVAIGIGVLLQELE